MKSQHKKKHTQNKTNDKSNIIGTQTTTKGEQTVNDTNQIDNTDTKKNTNISTTTDRAT